MEDKTNELVKKALFAIEVDLKKIGKTKDDFPPEIITLCISSYLSGRADAYIEITESDKKMIEELEKHKKQ